MTFNNTINELAQNEAWTVKEYESSNAQIAFFNNMPEKTIEFALFENEELMLEGSYNKKTYAISYGNGRLLDIVSQLTLEERNTNIIERLDLSLMMMNQALTQENKKLKMK